MLQCRFCWYASGCQYCSYCQFGLAQKVGGSRSVSAREEGKLDDGISANQQGKFIVGRVTVTTFLRRMEGQYSKAKKVLKGFGKDGEFANPWATTDEQRPPSEKIETTTFSLTYVNSTIEVPTFVGFQLVWNRCISLCLDRRMKLEVV